MSKKNKKINFHREAKRVVSLNIISIWLAFMTGYNISIGYYIPACMSCIGLYLTIILKEKIKQNGERFIR